MRKSALWCFLELEENVTVLDLSYSRIFHLNDLLMEDAGFANVETSQFPWKTKF